MSRQIFEVKLPTGETVDLVFDDFVGYTKIWPEREIDQIKIDEWLTSGGNKK